MPSEYEWEYACRGIPGELNEPRDWCFGGDAAQLNLYAFYDQDWIRGTTSVGQFRPWAALYDMHGNVWEWTETVVNFANSREDTSRSVNRVLRGGAFNFLAEQCRVAFREEHHPLFTELDVGLRVARSREF